jgi:hypothetical protein
MACPTTVPEEETVEQSGKRCALSVQADVTWCNQMIEINKFHITT